MLPERPFKCRVHKFIIVPVLTLYSEHGDVIGEKNLKAASQFTTTGIDLKNVAEKIEDKLNAEICAQKASENRLTKVQGNSGKVRKQSASRQVRNSGSSRSKR